MDALRKAAKARMQTTLAQDEEGPYYDVRIQGEGAAPGTVQKAPPEWTAGRVAQTIKDTTGAQVSASEYDRLQNASGFPSAAHGWDDEPPAPDEEAEETGEDDEDEDDYTSRVSDPAIWNSPEHQALLHRMYAGADLTPASGPLHPKYIEYAQDRLGGDVWKSYEDEVYNAAAKLGVSPAIAAQVLQQIRGFGGQ